MKTKKTDIKVVVTGGAGFIGSNLVDTLVKEGYEVWAVDNLSNGKMENVHPKAIFRQMDIRKMNELLFAFHGAKYVFHCAALPRVQYSIDNPRETDDVNTRGTFNVLDAAYLCRVKRVIYSASSSAYGNQAIMPLGEYMPAKPMSPYAAQKLIGEIYCKTWSAVYNLETVSLRYFNVYGPRNSAEGAYALVIAKFIAQRQKGKSLTITGDGKQTRDFTHVHDVVRANILAMSSPNVGKGEVINIGAGKNISINEIARLVGGRTKHIAPRFEPKDTLADNMLAKQLLGWEPLVSIEKGIAELKKIAGIK